MAFVILGVVTCAFDGTCNVTISNIFIKKILEENNSTQYQHSLFQPVILSVEKEILFYQAKLMNMQLGPLTLPLAVPLLTSIYSQLVLLYSTLSSS